MTLQRVVSFKLETMECKIKQMSWMSGKAKQDTYKEFYIDEANLLVDEPTNVKPGDALVKHRSICAIQ